MEFKYLIEKDDIVKDFLLKQGISKALGRKIKLYGEIFINSQPAQNWYPLKKGDILFIRLHEASNPVIKPSREPLDIIYEDETLLIVNKPANLTTQPSKKHAEDSLIARVKYYYDSQGIPGNIHVVTRLDLATSGLMLLAKNAYIHHQLMQRKIEKKYLARIQGIINPQEGIINLPIKRLEGSSLKRQVAPDGKPSLTEYRVLQAKDNESILELKLLTGRCHQIRVHLSFLGYPIFGDKLYGIPGETLFLHSYYLGFLHPVTNEFLSFTSYPHWFQK
jgi:23S rRNA pseudouridine1911/1915/1917 synthase